jgi:hypothetical protein
MMSATLTDEFSGSLEARIVARFVSEAHAGLTG